jgi:uncharacterized membrane-anchored protein YitT (DUF2179 family)
MTKRRNIKRSKTFNWTHDLLMLSIGVFAAAVGLKAFIIPNGFIDGGITGVSLLVNMQIGISLPVILVIINIPFFILGWRQINLDFAVRMVFGVVCLSLVIAFMDLQLISDDKILAAIFGGALLGAGIGFAVRGGGVLDGTEVLALFINRHTTFTIGDVILAFNVVLFSIASIAALFLGAERALYSVLTYLAASKAVDFIIEGIEEYVGVTIVSDLASEIIVMIKEEIGRGVTVYQGIGGFGKRGESRHDREILYTVVTRLEVAKLKKEVLLIDNKAFIAQNSVKEIDGGMIKPRSIPTPKTPK